MFFLSFSNKRNPILPTSSICFGDELEWSYKKVNAFFSPFKTSAIDLSLLYEKLQDGKKIK